MDVLDHECPSCGANIPFNPVTQKWDCKYCGASYNLEDFKKYDNEIKEENKKEEKIEIDEYECPNCGAKVVTDSNTSATSCVYCGSTTIIKNRLQGEFKPSKVIPFSQPKERAIEEFYKFSKKKWFAPKEFCRRENIQKVEGVYIPFWLYNCKSSGKIQADLKRFTTWSSGDYRYTKVDIYDCVREGNMEFIGVPVDGSTKFADDIMDSIEPYDYEKMKGFSPSYLSGFLAEKYDVEMEDAYSRAKSRINNSTIAELKSNISGFDVVTVRDSNIDIQRDSDEYVLLPVWMLNIMYKNKMYTFAMNGQTGKMVGNVPISPKKLILKALIVELLLTTIFALIKIFI